jgi:hypothetical protein
MSHEAEILAKLPAGARGKFSQIIAARDERREALTLASDAARGKQSDVQDALAAVSTARGEPGVEQSHLRTVWTKPTRDPAAEERARIRLQSAQAELASRQRHAAEREAALVPLDALVGRIVNTLHPVPAECIVSWEGSAPTLRKAEQPTDALNRLRVRLKQIDRERRAVMVAPVDVDTAKDRARAAVGELVARGRPNIEVLLHAEPSFSWPKSSLQNQVVWIQPWSIGMRGETPIAARRRAPRHTRCHRHHDVGRP